LPFSQEPAISPYPEPDESSPHPHTLFKVQFNTVLPSTPRSPKFSSLQVFRLKFWMHFISLPYVLLTPPISSSLI